MKYFFFSTNSFKTASQSGLNLSTQPVRQNTKQVRYRIPACLFSKLRTQYTFSFKEETNLEVGRYSGRIRFVSFIISAALVLENLAESKSSHGRDCVRKNQHKVVFRNFHATFAPSRVL